MVAVVESCSRSCRCSGRDRKSLREVERSLYSKGQKKLARIANDLCLKLDNKRSELLALLVQGDPGCKGGIPDDKPRQTPLSR